MKELDLRLNALVDFPDDCWAEPFDYQALRSLLEKLTEYRIDRLYWYWYGDRRDKWFWDHHNPQKEAGRIPGCVQTALNMPDFIILWLRQLANWE